MLQQLPHSHGTDVLDHVQGDERFLGIHEPVNTEFSRGQQGKIGRTPEPARSSVFEPAPGETPSTKPHAPKRFQISKQQTQKQMPGQTARRSVFEVGAWSFFGVWNL